LGYWNDVVTPIDKTESDTQNDQYFGFETGQVLKTWPVFSGILVVQKNRQLERLKSIYKTGSYFVTIP